MGDPKPVSVSAITTSVLGRNVKGGVGRFGIWSTWRAEEIEVEEFAAAFVRLENGGVMLFKTCWAANADSIGPAVLPRNEGRHGAEPARRQPADRGLLQPADRRPQHDRGARRGSSTYDDWPLKIKAFAEAVRDGRPSPIDPRGVYLDERDNGRRAALGGAGPRGQGRLRHTSP